MSIHPFTNSAIPIERMEIEQLLDSMIAVQNLTGRIAQAMLNRLDDIDGDPDIEPNGDERDGSSAEDDFWHHPSTYAAGCPVSDPGGCEHDGREPEDGR